MSIILEIDKYQRKIISIMFRILLVGYSIFLLLFYSSKYSLLENVGAFVLYILFYGMLYRREKWFSILRLLNDYLFITFILLQLETIDLYSYALLFAPILNTHNHSGNRKSLLLYLFPIASLFVVEKEVEPMYVFPFFLFMLINSFDTIRSKYFKFQQKLNSVIDDFFINEKEYNRPYKIYEKIIPIFNSANILPQKISKIICLRIEGNKQVIINGSSFIWDFRIADKVGFLKKIRSRSTFYNIELVIDGETIQNNLIHICSINSHYYCYLILSQENKDFHQVPFSIFIPKLINPFFHRLSKVFDADLNQKRSELKKLNELEEKINYVTNSVNSMHFIRNKLGPVKSYLAMVGDYNRSDANKRRKIEPYLHKERQKLSASISQILERADYILTKSNNPFNVYQTTVFGIQELFSEIRRVWSYYFEDENFIINWDTNKDRIKYDVKYNLVGIELVLSNWISNMYKYNAGEYGVVLNETEEYYSVRFYNSLEMSKSVKFIEEYTSSNRIEIERRSSRGLLEVKDFLSQMNISSEMYLSDNIVYFSLDFKKYLYDESLNN